MKTIVLEREVSELAIKPHEMLAEYRRLTEQEIETSLVTKNTLIPCVCPGCLSEKSNVAFKKSGMIYHQCHSCATVYVSPRPSSAALDNFYRDSRSSRFWREKILAETREMRREKIFRPRAEWLLQVVDQYRPAAQLGIVVGYHNDLLVQELIRQESHLFRLIVTNPLADLEFVDMDLPGVAIHPTPMDTFHSLGPADIVLAFDILDRCFDADALFAAARSALAPGGLFLCSTTLSTGFDIQMLWDRSESVYPPERLNLLSTEGLTALFERHGFKALEFSTPGTFDVEIVQRAIHADPDGQWPRFIRHLIENCDEDARNAFQEYLQRYRLSSFARIVLRRS